MADINLGDYEVDEDSNGNLVFRDSNDNIVLEHDGSSWSLGSLPVNDVSSLGDAASGDIYDGTDLTATVTGDVDNQSVTTEDTRTNSLTKTGRSGPQQVDEDGIWYYHNDKTVVHNPDANLTYVAYYRGDSEEEMLAQYDHDAGSLSYEVLKSGFGLGDDHVPASIEILDNGTIAVAYADHERDNQIFYRFSSGADISTLGSEQSISPSTDHTYPFIVQQDGYIYIWYRANFGDHAYVRSSDGGSTWSSPTIAITASMNNRVYAKKQMDGQGRLHMALNDTDSNSFPHEDVYYVRFEGGSFYTADGTSLGSTIATADLTPLYDTSSEGNYDTFSWDIAVDDETGDIAIVHSEFRDDNQHIYRYIRWDNDAQEWWSDQLCHGGSSMAANQDIRFYSHAASFDPQDPNKLYVSIGDRESSRVHRFVSPDDGQSWDISNVSDNAMKNTRPRVPQNAHPEMEVLWCRGSYLGYRSYDMSLMWTTAEDERAEIDTPPVSSVQQGGTTIWADAINTEVSGDDSWTDIKMTASGQQWIDDSVSSDGNKILIHEPGLYVMNANLRFGSVNSGASGMFEARIHDGSFTKAFMGRKHCQEGEKPHFSTTSIREIKAIGGQSYPLELHIEARQSTGQLEATASIKEETNLTVYRLGR